MLIISECTRDIPCIDCDESKCLLKGKKESSCPKWKCDHPGTDCETECEFIDQYIAEMRGKNNGSD